jgi:hypothetical protein
VGWFNHCAATDVVNAVSVIAVRKSLIQLSYFQREMTLWSPWST